MKENLTEPLKRKISLTNNARRQGTQHPGGATLLSINVNMVNKLAGESKSVQGHTVRAGHLSTSEACSLFCVVCEVMTPHISKQLEGM